MVKAELLADIDFGLAGNSAAFVLDGWAEPEHQHRWTLGRESRLRIPVQNAGPDCVLAVNATPCRHPPLLTGQMVMLAVNGRLLATLTIEALHVAAFRLPAGIAPDGVVTLGITHLSYGLPRAAEQWRKGEPLGLMMHSVRVFRLALPETAPVCLPRIEGRSTIERRTKLKLPHLAEQFESLGQGCHFGLIQRQCGAEPLGLLRFVDATTSHLFDGLVAGFAGIGEPGGLELSHTDDAQPRYKWLQRTYRLMFDTRQKVDDIAPGALLNQQSRRLALLQRKFLEDLRAGEKICVLTRGDLLTFPEALAIHCALQLHGPNTLLWTVFGDAEAAGTVEMMIPGLLCGQLGDTDEHRYASREAWTSIMANAYLLQAASCIRSPKPMALSPSRAPTA